MGTFARKGHLALLVIHPLRKGAGSGRGAGSQQSAHAVRVVAEDLRGSSHISAAARSVMALSVVGGAPGLDTGAAQPGADAVAPEGAPPRQGPPCPEGAPPGKGARSRFDGPRCLEIVKTNLCRHPPPLGLIFEGEGVPVPTLRYSEYVEPAPEPTQTELCAAWLHRFLDTAGEPVKPADAMRAAREEAYSRRTVYRARNLLGGLVVDLGTGPYDPHKRWALATGHTREGIPAAPDST
mgnify:CR=1 FL=1